MTMNTNNHARRLRKALAGPRPYNVSPWQWGYIAAIHAAATTTLHSGCTAGDTMIFTNAAVAANSIIQIGTGSAAGGTVQVQACTGSGAPFTVTLVRGAPTTQSTSAQVRVVPTVDVFLDGWQNPPPNLPPGVVPILTTGVRYLSNYTPAVGHVALIGRGTGLQSSDRFVLDRLAT